MSLFLTRDLTYATGIYRKGTEVLPVRDSAHITRLRDSFSSQWADRMQRDYIPCSIGRDATFRWVNKHDVA